MLVEVKTVSPRLSGHHAALFLGALSVLRDAVALASGHDTARILARLNAIAMPGEGPPSRASGARREARRTRGKRPLVDRLAFAGLALVGEVEPQWKTRSVTARDAEAALSRDAALQALVVHGLLRDASSDDGFEVEELASGSITATLRDDFDGVERRFHAMLKGFARLLRPGADPKPVRGLVTGAIVDAARPVVTVRARGGEGPGANRMQVERLFLPAAVAYVGQELLRSTLVDAKATSLLVLEDGGDGLDDAELTLPSLASSESITGTVVDAYDERDEDEEDDEDDEDDAGGEGGGRSPARGRPRRR
jgi:hypothetical protein